MTSVEFICKNLKEYLKDNNDLYVAPNIPENKLNIASKAFDVSHSHIVALYDSTLLGGADAGICLTGEEFVFVENKFVGAKPIKLRYDEIKQFEYTLKLEREKSITEKVTDAALILGGGLPGIGAKKLKDKLLDKSAKTNQNSDTFTSDTILVCTSKHNIMLEKILDTQYIQPFCDFMNELIQKCKEFKNENVLPMPLESLGEDIKEAYVRIIINMAFENETQMDEKELAEIYSLMSRINIGDEARVALRSYIVGIVESVSDSEQHSKLVPIADLIKEIKEHSEPIHQESIMISLVKDLICVYVSTQVEFDKKNVKINIDNFTFLTKHKELFELSQEKIEIARQAVEQDFKILYEDIDDDTIKKTMKDFAAKAASIGVPIGAVYLSGSVMGLSATGITSGLAALGLGMGMATGIGVAVLLGVGVYQGVKYITRDDSLSRYQMRETMLHEIIKHTQKTISLMIGDINVIVGKLNETILNSNRQQGEIDKVKEILANPINLLKLYQASIAHTNNKYNECINMETRCKCPSELEISRISYLENEPTKKEIYQFIVSCYEETSTNDETKYKLKANIPTDKLENLSKILEGIGYFDMKNITKDKASNLANNVLKKSKGFFNG